MGACCVLWRRAQTAFTVERVECHCRILTLSRHRPPDGLAPRTPGLLRCRSARASLVLTLFAASATHAVAADATRGRAAHAGTTRARLHGRRSVLAPSSTSSRRTPNRRSNSGRRSSPRRATGSLQIALGKVVQEDLDVAFRPSRRAAFDSLTTLAQRSCVPAQGISRVLGHCANSSTHSAILSVARRRSPRRYARRSDFCRRVRHSEGQPPLVAFAVFRDDGYSLGPGVIVDLIHAYESGTSSCSSRTSLITPT